MGSNLRKVKLKLQNVACDLKIWSMNKFGLLLRKVVALKKENGVAGGW